VWQLTQDSASEADLLWLFGDCDLGPEPLGEDPFYGEGIECMVPGAAERLDNLRVDLLELGKHLVSNPVAAECDVFVACIFAPRQPLASGVGKNVLTTERDHRPDEGAGDRIDSRKAGASGAAREVEEDRFGSVILRVPCGDPGCAELLGGLQKEPTPNLSGRPFATCPPVNGRFSVVQAFRDVFQLHLGRQGTDERLISIRVFAAPSVVEMCDTEREAKLRGESVQGMHQNNRVDTTGHADENAFSVHQHGVLREGLADSFEEHATIVRFAPHVCNDCRLPTSDVGLGMRRLTHRLILTAVLVISGGTCVAGAAPAFAFGDLPMGIVLGSRGSVSIAGRVSIDGWQATITGSLTERIDLRMAASQTSLFRPEMRVLVIRNLQPLRVVASVAPDSVSFAATLLLGPVHVSLGRSWEPSPLRWGYTQWAATQQLTVLVGVDHRLGRLGPILGLRVHPRDVRLRGASLIWSDGEIRISMGGVW